MTDTVEPRASSSIRTGLTIEIGRSKENVHPPAGWCVVVHPTPGDDLHAAAHIVNVAHLAVRYQDRCLLGNNAGASA
jgi:hypothetical protein